MRLNVWETLTGEPSIDLGAKLQKDCGFKLFVMDMPFFLSDLLPVKLTIQSLMKAQFITVNQLRGDLKQPNVFAKLASGLSQYDQAEEFLNDVGETVKSYCIQTSGMTEMDFSHMLIGEWAVKNLLEIRPHVILAPLLRRPKI